ncbi:MAG TPA: MarC family protein [Burkholderiales bacterium]|nr:MarC family protein [Burkholderiales bacterium]
MNNFLLCFVPLFVAVDAIGVLPVFLGLTERLSPAQRQQLVVHSVLTATVVAFLFALGGSLLLRLLGITVADFMVAGGALLFVFSLTDLILQHKPQPLDSGSLGVVPIGVPLLAGPAVLTVSMLLADQYGRALVSAALAANMVLAGVVLTLSGPIHRALGTSGARVVQRIMLLLLAAIAVMTMRKGVEVFLHGGAGGPYG